MYFKGTKYKPGNVIKSTRYSITYKILDVRPKRNGRHLYRIRTNDGYNISKDCNYIDNQEHFHLSISSILKKL